MRSSGGHDWIGVDDDLDFVDLHDPADQRSALLIDVENVCSGARRPGRTLARLRRLIAAAGPVESTIAMAADDVAAQQRDVLASAGVPVVAVPAGHNSADEALLAHARELAEQGVTRFYVASGDYIFARIASFAELVVLTHPDHEVSARLAGAATEIRNAG